MKKFVSYLALTAFAVASHMSAVHAWDMFGMGMDDGHAMKSGHSIFCSEAPAENDSSDCAKQSVPEKGVVVSKSYELPEVETRPQPFERFVRIETESARDAALLAVPPPPWQDGSAWGWDYSARVGADVKKLD
ncbi:MAG: hypothetical protein QMC36_04215 [Patescibacteria group bacterium]